MPNIMYDGTVIPSQYSVQRAASDQGSGWSNTLLRVGEVREIIYPDDDRNMSKSVIEYRVSVQHYDHDSGAGARRDYYNCVLINSLGSLADKLHYTLRQDDSKDQKIQPDGKGLIGKGSKVLLLCINGDHRSAIILGGLRDKEDTFDKAHNKVSDPSNSLGHHLHFVFNGLEVWINRDGELTVQRQGATDTSGKPLDGTIAGPIIKADKNGGFLVITPSGSTFSISEGDKKGVKILSGGAWVTIDGNGVTIGDPSGATATLKDGNFQVIADSASIGTKSTDLVSSPDSHAVRGEDLLKILTNLITTISSLTIVVAGGAGTVNPASVAQLQTITAQLQGIISKNVRLT